MAEHLWEKPSSQEESQRQQEEKLWEMCARLKENILNPFELLLNWFTVQFLKDPTWKGPNSQNRIIMRSQSYEAKSQIHHEVQNHLWENLPALKGLMLHCLQSTSALKDICLKDMEHQLSVMKANPTTKPSRSHDYWEESYECHEGSLKNKLNWKIGVMMCLVMRMFNCPKSDTQC